MTKDRIAEQAPDASETRSKTLASRFDRWRTLPRPLAGQRALYTLRSLIYRTPLHRVMVMGHAPTALAHQPSDTWPGDAKHGSALLGERFHLAGVSLNQPRPLWAPVGASPAWLTELHAFEWIKDLKACGGDAARRRTRELVLDWIKNNARWQADSWAPDVVGRRISTWLLLYDFFADSAEPEDRALILASLSQQARYLHRTLPAGLAGGRAIEALKGLLMAALALPGGEAWWDKATKLMSEALPGQILADGGQAERNPSSHLALLKTLIDLRAFAHACERESPRGLDSAIEALAPMLRTFRHGDGKLALFNGSFEEDEAVIDLVLQRAGDNGRARNAAPQSGYQRLQIGRSTVLVDCGRPPQPGYDEVAHAGTLSFEMSIGRERLLVNCGAHPGRGQWHHVGRCTAAHTTAVVGERNSSEVLKDGGLGRKPQSVTCRREESEGAVWLDMSHDGYHGLGLVHHRRVYLSADGEDLRGEDRFEGSHNQRVAIRLHLHPEVQASLAQGGDGAILKLAKGGGWRLKAGRCEVSLEPSVYLGSRNEIRRSLQVVLAADLRPGHNSIKWSLKKVPKKAAAR